MALSEQFQALLAGVAEEESRLQAEKDQLMAQVAAIDTDLRRLTAVRRAADPEAAKPKPKPAAKKTPGWSVSEPTIERVWAAWQAHGETPESVTKLADKMPNTSPQTVRSATEMLRERGYIVIAGPARGGGKLYAVAPDAPARLVPDGTAA